MTPGSLAIKAGMALKGGAGGYFASEAAMSQHGLYPVEKELMSHVNLSPDFLFKPEYQDGKVTVRAVNRTLKRDDGSYSEYFLYDHSWSCEINLESSLRENNEFVKASQLKKPVKDQFFSEIASGEEDLVRGVMKQLIEECSKNRVFASDWSVVGSVTLTETGETGGKYFFRSNYRLNPMLGDHASSHNEISWFFEEASMALENTLR